MRGPGRRRSPRRRKRPRGLRGPFRRGAPRRRGRARDRRPGGGRCTRRPGTPSCDGRGRSRTRRAPRAFASLRRGRRWTFETNGFFPQRRIPFECARSKKSCDSSSPKSASCAASPAPGADVAALDGDRTEELEEVVHDALHETEGASGAVVEDRGGPGFGADRQEALGSESEGVLPRDRAESGAVAKKRRREPVRRVLAGRELRGSRAEEALRDRVGRVSAEPHEPAVLDGGDQSRRHRGSRGCRRCAASRSACGGSYGLCAPEGNRGDGAGSDGPACRFGTSRSTLAD